MARVRSICFELREEIQEGETVKGNNEEDNDGQ